MEEKQSFLSWQTNNKNNEITNRTVTPYSLYEAAKRALINSKVFETRPHCILKLLPASLKLNVCYAFLDAIPLKTRCNNCKSFCFDHHTAYGDNKFFCNKCCNNNCFCNVCFFSVCYCDICETQCINCGFKTLICMGKARRMLGADITLFHVSKFAQIEALYLPNTINITNFLQRNHVIEKVNLCTLDCLVIVMYRKPNRDNNITVLERSTYKNAYVLKQKIVTIGDMYNKYYME
ncbi:hypothetical protein [Epiphyas postvittana nucleopolyhedrovirus]|uniref:Uncharacterized protein n=1 Tax=Epiphyas postvittana nucleopolyhedrovirus TaxID=70600 RepID=Q91GE9_NPVEP|nr:hypothetical protein [Epiphyas postvittana nucleopolyhedrovirus]AAK85669.1 unknown [Epiphyas postvittana nucleopolyhedrovirus]